MKIVFFTNEYAHPKLPSSGGVGSFLKTMAESMSKLGHEVHIYGFSKRAVAFGYDNIKITYIKNYKKQFPFSEFLRSISGKLNLKNAELNFLKKERRYLAKELKNYCKIHDIDIIESFVFNGFTAYWNNSTPLVIRFHGSRGFWHYYLGAKKEEHKIHMEQKALEATPYTVTVSQFSANALKHIYAIDVDTIIYNGIDANLFAPNPNIKEIEHSIFYFGTISKAKGLDTLCKVFNEVIKAYPDASLHLIGRGTNYLDHLKTNVLSPVAKDNVTYYGAKQIEELPKLVSKATVCVFPSLNETFGLIIAEAMALQKPVIASDIPSFNEIITPKENGFIAKTLQDYTKYIDLIFTNSEEKLRISKNARAHVLSTFTKEKMVETSIAYYQEILDQN
ncbi:glycosyltransferase family 4 protein [uncultured Psychroserpens sp.]|uniref:glycosyltransferase family 4 protein n=1 Tax=uncultured Psychroserpens sp. TaxID=255436 RepID=UPI002618E3BD|nr:glycosyltransferase family 4 protein [uncultured Psychroserpens sp.]